MRNRILAATLVAICSLSATPALAATQIVDGSGKLTGATDVVINGSTYTVQFVDGTCTSVFGGVLPGCDATSDFAFTTFTGALAAAQALLDQVFLDTTLGQFDSDYTLTYGCASNPAEACYAKIPYGPGFSANSINTNVSDSTDLALTDGSDFSTNNQFVFAKFTLSGAVPEPSTWAMMLLGFGAIGFVTRRSRAGLKLA